MYSKKYFLITKLNTSNKVIKAIKVQSAIDKWEKLLVVAYWSVKSVPIVSMPTTERIAANLTTISNEYNPYETILLIKYGNIELLNAMIVLLPNAWIAL